MTACANQTRPGLVLLVMSDRNGARGQAERAIETDAQHYK
jgi:hypothetical protein